MGYQDDIWDAAEFITEWDGSDGLWYKLYSVPREAIDEDDDESEAVLVHGLDDGSVRRVDQLLDPAYDRWDSDMQDIIDELINDKKTPAEAKRILQDITPNGNY